MAFTVEDGTGKADANAYCTVEFANEYHKDRGNAAWTGAGSAKQAAIIRATTYIESMFTWATGYRWSSTQRLSWPRAEAEDIDGNYYDTDEVPLAVQEATAELAVRALSQVLIDDSERIAKREKVGELEVEYEQPGGGSVVSRYPIVEGLLRHLTSTGGATGGGGYFSIERG